MGEQKKNICIDYLIRKQEEVQKRIKASEEHQKDLAEAMNKEIIVYRALMRDYQELEKALCLLEAHNDAFEQLEVETEKTEIPL